MQDSGHQGSGKGKRSDPFEASTQSSIVKKNINNLSPANKKIIKRLNMMKGNINFMNEMLDACQNQ